MEPYRDVLFTSVRYPASWTDHTGSLRLGPRAGGNNVVPVVFRYRGVRFFFFSNEGSPREPLHIHALRGAAEAKFWLNPGVQVAESAGFSARALVEMVDVVGAASRCDRTGLA